MRYIILTLLCTLTSMAGAQSLVPRSVNVSYFGETITHPGLKVGVGYNVKDWRKPKVTRNGRETVLLKSFDFSPSLGFFYHRGYQTALFALPEFSYTRRNEKGNYVAFGIGVGYMRTFIPNVYELNSTGEIDKVREGDNYFITSYSLALGKNLNGVNAPASVFIKPQLLNARPNYSGSVWYLVVEIGVSYALWNAR